jgi:hypothetical protein
MPSKSDQRKIAEYREAKESLSPELLKHPDVRSVGIGYRRKNGKKTSELCIVVGVRKKVPANMVESGRLLPSKLSYFSRIAGKEIQLPVDVIEIGEPQAYACGPCATNLKARVRPVPGGFSISGPPGTGTLGGWVWDNLTDQVVLISNNHVLGGVAGSAVLQQGGADGGVVADRIASIIRTGTLDATIASPDASDIAKTEIECLGGAVFEIVEPALDMQVEKVGRTTSRTCGTISQIHVDLGHFGSTNDFITDTDDPAIRFAFFGDSGSLIVERTNPAGNSWRRVVGLLWGGVPDDFNAFAHPMGDVFANLSLTTVCAGVIESFLDSIVFSASEFGLKEDDLHRNVRRGFAREMEKRFLDKPTGKKIHQLLHANRVAIIPVLMSGDGRRAALLALRPILAGKVTTEEVLQHKLTKADIENFGRLIKVARQMKVKMPAVLAFSELLLKRAEGKTIASLIALKKV